MEPLAVQQYGLVGGMLVGMFLLVRQLMVWMQGRLEVKDDLIREAMEKQTEMSNTVIKLANESAARTAETLKALTVEIQRMGDGICERLDRMEGK